MSTKTKKATKKSTKKSTKAPATQKSSGVVDTIHSRAMLVTLSVSAFQARRFDRKVTEKVNREYAADEHAGRYNKHLFGGTKHAPSHSAVLSAASAARQIHYDNTLPWNDEGWRLLPTSNYFVYQEQMREVRERFERAVRTFIEDYPNLKRAITYLTHPALGVNNDF